MTPPPTHPLADLLPPMSDDEFNALVQDIDDNGLLEPVWIHHGKVIDGRHRLRACEQLGLDPQFREWSGEGSLVSFILSLNLKRRHLDASQKACLALEFLPFAEAEAKERQRKLNTPLSIQECEASEGKGKASAKAASLFGVSQSYIEKAKALKESDPERFERVKCGALPITRAEQEVRLEQSGIRKEELAQLVESLEEQNITLACGDFRELSLRLHDESVNLILADLPYGKEGLMLWEPLAEMASRVLQPGGYLITYSGQFFVPEILAALTSREVRYLWMGYLEHHKHQQIFPVQMMTGGKPVFFLYKPPLEKREIWFCDLIKSEDWQKDRHDWAQDMGSAVKIVDAFTKPGDVVLDPSMGSGTVGLACKQLKREFIGFESDEETFSRAAGRIEQSNKEENVP